MKKFEGNLTRMIQLAEQFFEVKNDPAQLAVTAEVIERLRLLHPRTLNEATDHNGPIAWVLVIPTTKFVMREFLDGKISERDLLEKTLPGTRYDALYLCSAIVLPEYRGRGIAKRLTMEAVESIRMDHPITALFYWSFSAEGEKLAASVAAACGAQLFRRNDKHDT